MGMAAAPGEVAVRWRGLAGGSGDQGRDAFRGD